jgi:exonuclease SbcC
MQILSVALRNIKSHRETELQFAPGINVLSGPNGIGKSTIFEAIGYALFGVDARDFVSNVERFLTIGSKRGEIAVVFVTDDGERWRVTRSVGAAAKWLLAREIGGAFEVEEHANLAETETRLRKLLGLDNGRPLAEQFKLVIGPLQNDFLGPFVIRQPTKRQEAFDEILGIDAWRKTFKGTSAMLTTVQESIKILSTEIEGKQEQLAVLPQKEQERARVQTETQSQQSAWAEKSTALEQAQLLLSQCDAQEKALNLLGNELQVLANRVLDGQGKIGEQQQRVSEAQQAQAILVASQAGKAAFEQAEARVKELRLSEGQRRSLEQDVTTLEKTAARLTQTLEHERGEIEKTDLQLGIEETRLSETRAGLKVDDQLLVTASRLSALRDEEKQLQTARGQLEGRRVALLEGQEKLAEGLCPFFQEPCQNVAGKTPRDVFSVRLEELDREQRTLEGRIAALTDEANLAETARQQLNSLQVRIQELEKQNQGLLERRSLLRQRAESLQQLQAQQLEAAAQANSRKAGLAAFVNLDANMAASEQERARHQPARDAFFAHQAVALELDTRCQTLEKWRKGLAELKQNHLTKQAERDRLQQSYDAEGHRQARLQKDALLGEVATLRQQLENLEKENRRLDQEIAALLRIRQDVEAKLAARNKREEQETLVKFLRNQVFKNVSARLSERFREEISRRADRIYRTIAETDEELCWGENYQVLLRDMEAGAIRERSDDQLSGGQMMSAVVALRLALLQTIGARIAFFDEPTSNLDAARRENLARAFRAIDVGREEVTEHWYDQLFLVSHDVAFTEITDQVLELGKQV